VEIETRKFASSWKRVLIAFCCQLTNHSVKWKKLLNWPIERLCFPIDDFNCWNFWSKILALIRHPTWITISLSKFKKGKLVSPKLVSVGTTLIYTITPMQLWVIKFLGPLPGTKFWILRIPFKILTKHFSLIYFFSSFFEFCLFVLFIYYYFVWFLFFLVFFACFWVAF